MAAYMGALGAALGTMVANLSAHKSGWDERWKEFSDAAADAGQALMQRLLSLVDEDTAAFFNRIKAAMGLPKGTDSEGATCRRHRGRNAICQPGASENRPCGCRSVSAVAGHGFGRESGLGDRRRRGRPCRTCCGAGCGTQCAHINAAGLVDRAAADELIASARALEAEAAAAEEEILRVVDSKI